MSYAPNARQVALLELLGGAAKHFLAYGGSRSGKTFEFVRVIVLRALLAPKSRHAIFRYRFNHCKASIVFDTFPRVMAECFPGVPATVNKSDWFWEAPNGSQVWFGGLDEKERTEKILGQEHSTLFFNEISQMTYAAVLTALTRLAQRVEYALADGKPRLLRLLALYDCNPPPKSHWSHFLWFRGLDPETKKPVDAARYAKIQMNPGDNLRNLAPDYLDTLRAMPARMQKRFLQGEYADDLPGALFTFEAIDRNRVEPTELPDLQRVVVAVDPSGADDDDNADNDEIGVVVVALGVDGRAYVLEDATCKAGPATWGAVVVSAHERHSADVVVVEVNFGGAMAKHVVETAARKLKATVRVKVITASRGKVVRAEPVGALNEQDKVKWVGHFTQLEDEACAMTTHGYKGSGSPNRVDAAVWGVSELFPGLVRREVTVRPTTARDLLPSSGSWFPQR